MFAAIDVVIPVHSKDSPSLDVVIDAVERHVEDVRNIYIISERRYTDRAFWIDEKNFSIFS